MARTKSQIALFVSYFREHGFLGTHVGREQTSELKRSWRNTFVARQHTMSSTDPPVRLDWEVFSLNRAAYTQGNDAIARYARHKVNSYLVWTEEDRIGSLICSGQPIPPYGVLEQAYSAHNSLSDVYVSSEASDWTFVLTHERACGLGPYYAEAEWQRTSKGGPLALTR